VQGKSFEEAVAEDVAKMDKKKANAPKKEQYCIDIETSPFTDSPLKALMLKSIQLDNNFIPVNEDNLPELKEQLQNKELIAFNSPFKQTQLARAGFNV
jgi:hypothetical protein